MWRPAPIWEPASPETSARPSRRPRGTGRDGLTIVLSVVAHLAARLGEEAPLGGGETVDAACRDFVEHAVDLRLRRVARGAARRLGRVARPCSAPRMDEHAGLGPTPQIALGPPQLPVPDLDRKSTRLNSSHDQISYAV